MTTILSPSVNEAVIARHFIRDSLTRETVPDPILVDLHDAVQSARVSGDKAQRIVAATLRSEMRTEAANHKMAREASFAAIESALTKLDQSRKMTTAEIDKLNKLVTGPPKAKDMLAEFGHQELRRSLLAMDRDERAKVLNEGLATGDTTLMSAILNGRPMLSGLTQSEHDMFLHRWRQKYYAAETDRAARLSKAITDAERAGTALTSFVDSLTDAAVIAKAERIEREMKDALKEAAG